MEQWLLIILVLINLVISIYALLRIRKFKFNQNEVSQAMSEFKLAQKDHYATMLKSLNDDFNTLKENIIINIGKFNEQTIREIMQFQLKMTNELHQNFNTLHKTINENLDRINQRVEYRLSEGFDKTNQTFQSIIERLSKIDEAQKKIESLSTNIVSLQDILNDKKARGTFGEVQLNHILTAVFGQNNTKIYEMQKKLSNNKIVDAIIHTPKPLGSIAIDSKFPLDNYQRIINHDLTTFEREEAERLFKQDVKNHINAIREKYIVPNETADSAIMFIPAEAVFAEINAHHQDLIEYSQRSKVWLASPTTLMFLLTTVQIVIRNMERDQYAAIIHQELNQLSVEFSRFKVRWDKLSQNIDQVSKNVKDLHVTSDKIEKHFDKIAKVEIINQNQSSIDLINNEEE